MIHIHEDFSDIYKALDEIGLKSKQINRKVLSLFGREGRKQARREIRSKTTRRSGELAGGMRFMIKPIDKLTVMPSPGKNWMKAEVLQRGWEVKSKSKPYMTFQIDGNWVKVKSFKIQPRGWFYSSFDSYINSGLARQDAEKLLVKEIDRIFNKVR